MSRKAFQDLLERYLKGQCTAEEEKIVHHWYDLLDSEEQVDIDDTGYAELEERLWHKINEETLPIKNKKRFFDSGRSRFRFYFSAAAAIVLLLAGAWWARERLCENPVDPIFVYTKNPLTVIKNSETEPMEVVLPDASRVKLFSGAQITYATAFKYREVSLVGDALFNVEANPANPFMVFHDEMITKVLGTRFLIKAGAKMGEDEVVVYSGTVEVIRSTKEKGLLTRIITDPPRVQLTMNQRAVLNKKEEAIRETLAEMPVPIAANEQLLWDVAFKEVTMADLAKRLSDVYGITIRVEPRAKKITFTGDLSDMELFDQLSMICNVTETTYQLKGKSIIIQ